MSTAVAFAPQKDGSVAFGYTPKDAGQTVISVQQNQQHIGGSPFNFCVDNVDGKFITAYGSGLAGGVTGEPCTFCVSGATAKGSIGVGVSGPADVPAKVTEGKDGVAMVTYVPTAGGVYAVAVTVNKKEIAGSPFQVKVSSEGRKKAQIAVNSTAKVSVNAKEKDVSALEAKIKAPRAKTSRAG